MVTKLALAIYNTVHGYHGGARAQASELDMNPATLDHKVNPQNDTHHIRLDETVAVMNITKNYSVLYALCDQLGFKPPAPKGEQGSLADAAVLELHASIHKELGDVSEKLLEALEDGRFSRNEIDAITKEAGEAIQALHDFINRLNG